MLLLFSCSVICDHYCGGVPLVLFSDNLACVAGGLVEYLEDNDLTSAVMNEGDSWLEGPGKIVAHLY